MGVVFFVKQKTAYEMRISDWSSDVCSSDLDDMPELGGDTPLETVLGDAQQIGFKGIELGGKFPRAAPALKALLDRFGLALVGGWYGSALLDRTAEAETAAMQPHLRLLQAMDTDVFVVAETSNAIHSDRSRSEEP